MIVVVVELDVAIPGAQSLKEKRAALESLKRRLRNSFNVSVAEVGEFKNNWQRAQLAVVSVADDGGFLASVAEKVLAATQAQRDLEVLSYHTRYVA